MAPPSHFSPALSKEEMGVAIMKQIPGRPKPLARGKLPQLQLVTGIKAFRLNYALRARTYLKEAFTTGR